MELKGNQGKVDSDYVEIRYSLSELLCKRTAKFLHKLHAHCD